MFNFFLPRKTKKILEESELIQGNLRRNRIYAQDTLNARDLDAVAALEARYPALLKARDVEGLEKLNKESMKLGNKLFPPSPWDGWRENVEVFVVAAIMALSIRTYFLQPFKIPTGSMEPTLYGIEPKPSTEVPPNPLIQAYGISSSTAKRIAAWSPRTAGKSSACNRAPSRSGSNIPTCTWSIRMETRKPIRIWIRKQDVEMKLGIYEYGALDFGDYHPHLEGLSAGRGAGQLRDPDRRPGAGRQGDL